MNYKCREKKKSRKRYVFKSVK